MAPNHRRLEALDRLDRKRSRQGNDIGLSRSYILDWRANDSNGRPLKDQDRIFYERAAVCLEEVFLELKYHHYGEYDVKFVRDALSEISSGLREEADLAETSPTNAKNIRSLQQDIEVLQHKIEFSREPLTHRERDLSRRKGSINRPQDERLKAVCERLKEIQESLYELERAKVFSVPSLPVDDMVGPIYYDI